MEIASLILSSIALVVSLVCLVWMLAKQLSTHQVQMVPVDPFKGMQDPLSEIMGKDPMKPFRELGEPLDEDELDYIERMKEKKAGR